MLATSRTEITMVFNTNEAINTILNYPEPSYLSVVEIMYNQEVLDVLSSLDYTEPNYNKIYDALYPDNINALKLIKKHTSRGRHNCSYKKTISGKGRYYIDSSAKKSHASLQNCYNRVRRLIVNGKLVAIDLSNAHLEIIKNIASFLKVPTDKYEILNFYCENRNQVLNDIMIKYDCDREVAKNYFIIILFGGSYDSWIINNNLLNKSSLKTEYMMKFEFAFDIIKQEINKLDIFNGFKVLEKQVNKKKDYKIERTALAILLQEIESKILVVMYQYLESKGCIIRIPIHDAKWFDDCNNITNNGTCNEFLIELSNEIKEKLGLIIPLDYENTAPTEEDLKWYANHKEFYDKYNETKHADKNIIEACDDDVGASCVVIKKFKDRLLRCGKVILVKYDNCWSFEKDEVNRHLANMIKDSNLYFYGSDGKRLYNYSNAVSHQMKCITAIRNSELIKVDNDFIKNITVRNKCYLPFIDGVYSFKDKKLYTYEELPEIPFTFKINRNFPKFHQSSYEDLMKRFIEPVFPDIKERNALLNRLARALAGHIEDKKWYGLGGARNSGKSKLIKLLQNSFGDFVSTFNANCLVYNKKSPVAEPAKGLMWVLNIWNSRLSCASEIEGDEKTTLNGGLIKKLASGGDAIKARGNYMDEVEFIPAFTPWFMYNEWYEVEPANACENLIQFTCPSKFVEADKLIDNCDILKLKDDTIDDFIRLDNIIDAFTLVILNNYDNILDLPESIVKFNKNDSTISIEEFIIKHFHKTKSDKDCIHMSHIKDIMIKYDYRLSPSNLRKKFETLKIGEYDAKHCVVNGNSSSGFKFLKYSNVDDDGNYEN